MTTKRKARRPKALKLQHMVLIAEPDRMCLDFDALCFFQVIDSIKEAKRLIRWLTQAVAWLEQEKSKEGGE